MDHAWIQTYTGRQFWPFRPDPRDICIEDVAHSLALTCRFNGHSNRFYSVAQHAVHVSRLVREYRHKLWGLLHDASEIYLCDLPSPTKRQIPAFKEIESRIQAAIAEAFGLPWPIPADVARADLIALATEKRDLMTPEPAPWLPLPPPDPKPIRPLPPRRAELKFLRMFYELQGLRPTCR